MDKAVLLLCLDGAAKPSCAALQTRAATAAGSCWAVNAVCYDGQIVCQRLDGHLTERSRFGKIERG